MAERFIRTAQRMGLRPSQSRFATALRELPFWLHRSPVSMTRRHQNENTDQPLGRADDDLLRLHS
jgi:hypothetical protein